MNWKQFNIHGNPPLSGEYIVAVQNTSNTFSHDIYHFDYDNNTWFYNGISTSTPFGWMEFNPFQKIKITKFH